MELGEGEEGGSFSIFLGVFLFVLCVDEDEINDPIEWPFRVKFVTSECPRGLSMGESSCFVCVICFGFYLGGGGRGEVVLLCFSTSVLEQAALLYRQEMQVILILRAR